MRAPPQINPPYLARQCRAWGENYEGSPSDEPPLYGPANAGPGVGGIMMGTSSLFLTTSYPIAVVVDLLVYVPVLITSFYFTDKFLIS